MKLLRHGRGFLAVAVVCGAASGCGSDASMSGGHVDPCPSRTCDAGPVFDARWDWSAPDLVTPPVPDAAGTRNVLCGQGLCDPGYSGACGAPAKPEEAGAADAGAATDAAGAGPPDASLPNPGDDAAVTSDDASSVFEDGAPPSTDAGHSLDDGPGAGGSDARADAKPAPMACAVRVGPSATTSVCEPAGTGESGSPCDDSSDCAPGLGCVEAKTSGTGGGTCRPFSCTLPMNCPAYTFYQELPLRQHGQKLSVNVPVCTPVDNCVLLTDSCGSELVCTIVGDNATSCLTPGEAALDQPCDDDMRCAPNLVCAKTTNMCRQLCHIGTDECVGGTCQGGNKAFPDGIGVCVGVMPDGG
jgi:hypothetical protein